MTADKDFKAQLVAVYDADVQRRVHAASSRDDWKVVARTMFAKQANAEHKTTLLELGAGAGLDAIYFKHQGFNVLATDISPNMVEACTQNGVEAMVLDLYNLKDLKQQLEAIYSINVLLHVPKKDLPQILATIHHTLTPEGIFFYGVYGGINKEEVFTDPKRMNLPRFFSFLDDTELQAAVTPLFEIINSTAIPTNEGGAMGLHFQSLLLRKK